MISSRLIGFLANAVFGAVLIGLGAVPGGGTVLKASEYLGFLEELTNPESQFASQLNLTEDQKQELSQLTGRRTSAAVGLAAELREAPKEDHSRLMADFAFESERMAFDLLDRDQQDAFFQLRLQWLGLASLAEDEVAAALNLADPQREIVAGWREQLRLARRANREEEVRPQAESSIRQEISDSQWAAWQVLAGLSPASELGPPVPPDRFVQIQENSEASEGVRLQGRPAEMEPGSFEDPDSSQDPDSAGEASSADDPGLIEIEQIELQLNFQRQPWADVVRWLADQADLSVHSETTPPGTFTYRDRSRTYTISEALDIMNAYLLDSGYALFRQGRMLRCVNFEEDQEMRGELLKELTDTVSPEELESRGRYEPVRVLFNLERLDPDEIIEEVEDLLSVQGTAVSLVTSGQLLVTDMAGNVRNIANFIRRAEDPNSARGATVRSIPLKSINAEEVLSVARPLLDLEEGSNVSEEIKISTNTFGTVIYARGDVDKIQILRDLVEQMDLPPEELERPATYEPPFIGRHLVRGIDLQLAYEVAAQLLAGVPDVKLATDETAKQLVLMGRREDHELIRETLDALAGEASDFKVIPLQNLDAQMAIAAVKKFFGLEDKPEAGSGDPVIDGDAVARQIWVKGSASQVRQIEDLIKKLESNAKSSRGLWGDRLRVLPNAGSGTADALRQAEILWREMYGGQNPIVTNSGISDSGGLKTRTFAPPKPDQSGVGGDRNRREKSEVLQSREARSSEAQSLEAQSGAQSSEARSGEARSGKARSGKARSDEPQSLDAVGVRPSREVSQPSLSRSLEDLPLKSPHSTAFGKLTSWSGDSAGVQEGDDGGDDGSQSEMPEVQGAPIVIREGPGGLMITSEDPEALDRFENLLRMIMEQTSLAEVEPEVVYLQNIKAAAAKQLLTDILSGTAGGDQGGNLLGDMASSMIGGLGGGMLGSLLGGGGGGATGPGSSGMAVGEYSIVADPRLNALFIKASPPDMRLIEQLLRVIDQVEGPFSVETQGVTELIPVLTQDVTDILNTVKSVFGDRIEGGGSSAAQGQGSRGQPNPAEFLQAMRSAFGGGRSRGGGGQQSAQSELNEPKIALGADTFTNTLIVIAQPSQIEEVRRLVEMLDEAGESEQEEVVVVEMGAIASTALSDSLKRVLGPKAQTTTASGSGSGTGTSRTGTSSSSSSSNAQFDADAARRRAEFFQRMMGGSGSGGRGNTGGGRGNTGGGRGNTGGGRGR
jgi:type II secretory pathway component GspD/PulD (secretin)